MSESTKEKYLKKLRKANLKESQNPERTIQLLTQCEQIISQDPDIIDKSDMHLRIIQNRIEYLKHRQLASPQTTIVSESSTNRVEEPVSTEEITHLQSVKREEKDEGIILPDIFPTIYTQLMHKEDPTYEDYLDFYTTLNEHYPDPFSPVMEDKTHLSYYIGDTHGGFEETLTMIHYFENVLEKYPETMIIFDGDYVDRNPLDLENVTVIMAFFAMNPSNVRVLRGNHEDNKINSHYGFIQHLHEHFLVQTKVETIYNQILTWFKKLPIIHIQNIRSDNLQENSSPYRVMCVHGGIPINNSSPYDPVLIENLQDLKTNVANFDEFDDLLSWLLWADPNEEITGIELHPETGRNKFGQDVFEQFIKANNIDLVVRAHEVLQNGYRFFFEKQLVSLFSTSSYKNQLIGTARFAKIEGPEAINFLSTDSIELDIDLAQL